MLSRRRFVAGVGSGLSLAGLMVSPIGATAAAARNALSEERRRYLQATLPLEDRRFDPFAKMLVVPAASTVTHQSPGRTGDVRGTTASLNYAVALLDSDERWRSERGNEILRVVIGLQDKNRSHETFGLWPWYLEEASAGNASTDVTMAEHGALPLLMALGLHRERLAKDILDPAREAIVRATGAIQRRPFDLDQTQRAVSGVSALLLAAQELKLADLRPIARERLRQLHAHIIGQQSFAEYNSPDAIVSVIREFSRLLWLLKDGRDKSLISEMHDLAWKHLATHFHSPTRQWAGPHSWTAETNLRKRPTILAFIQSACGELAELGVPQPLPLGLDTYRIPLQCPRKWARLIAALESPRAVKETFVAADAAKDGKRNPVVGTTWLHPRFALGTVNRGDLGSGRRPLLACWGMASAPRFLRVRFLKDDSDFASALFFSVQHEGAALAVVTLCTHDGTSNPTLAPVQNGMIRASSLKVRFECEGELADCTMQAAGQGSKGVIIQDRDARFLVRPVEGRFGDAAVEWDSPSLRLASHFDITLYHGPAKDHKLSDLSAAFAAFTIEEWPYDLGNLAAGNIEAQVKEGKLRARAILGGRALDFEAHVKPTSRVAMDDAFRSAVL
ncbi:MAG: hypothetical protein IPK15_19255 [Verrucomicrobia bacterium]|nr:hypothetical protein [Verrucomicrobiota bacterium]